MLIFLVHRVWGVTTLNKADASALRRVGGGRCGTRPMGKTQANEKSNTYHKKANEAHGGSTKVVRRREWRWRDAKGDDSWSANDNIR
ncbi:hypothetical protein U1Q18_047986 [Sarracenia purpurea var. burkii]